MYYSVMTVEYLIDVVLSNMVCRYVFCEQWRMSKWCYMQGAAFSHVHLFIDYVSRASSSSPSSGGRHRYTTTNYIIVL